ncbi:MAG: gliding motility-associated C-terminal domain-containing protein, partial [Saprospiraceae bacterium]
SADRDSLTIDWGDGLKSTFVRINGPKDKDGLHKGEELQNDIKKNIYKGEHTYTGFAPFYVITMTDPNRNAGILNINAPFSDSVQFSLSTTFTFLSQQFQGVNSTPILLQPPIDFGCVGEVFIHNPNAYDVDGDSLYYQLTEPRAAPGVKVPNYVYPNRIGGGMGNNVLTLNENTGELIWNSPQKAGEYNVTIMVIEFRQGRPIDTLIRDMQIQIRDNCKNDPPQIAGGKDICVVAGTLVEFKVIATDPNDSPKLQKVVLTALGGPFQTTTSPASFIAPAGYQNDPVTGTFRWQTTCEHISNQYYNVVFKAVDNFLFDSSGLATLKTFRIKIVAPPPIDLKINTSQSKITLNWENPYICDKAANNYFYGFSVWRKENSLNLQPDTCDPGLKGKGYTRLVFKSKTINNNRYEYVDASAERGITYCYRVQAEFARLTSSGVPYNLVEGLPSKEVCMQLNRDIPLPLEVDVIQTSSTNGKIKVAWNKPNPNDLDTILNKGPYRYELTHSTAENGVYTPVFTFIANAFGAKTDTTFEHQSINTNERHFYKISFYVNSQPTPLGVSPVASSIFLSITATDKTNILSWNEKTPWSNSKYAIFRKSDATGIFDSVGLVTSRIFNDEGLQNGRLYCYFIKSYGAYSINGIRQPLINRSQELCAVPIDDVAPCAPDLLVANTCNNPAIPESDTTENFLSWNNIRRTCLNGKDASGYQIFYRKTTGSSFELLATINNFRDTTYIHGPLKSLAGCYFLTAFDSLKNTSVPGNIVCV